MKEFILHFCMSFISACGVTFLYCRLSDLKVKLNFRIISIFLIGVFFLSLIKYYNISNVYAIAYFVFYPILFYNINNASFKPIVISTLFIWLIGVILDLISMLVVSFICYIFNISLNIYYELFSILLTIAIFLIFISIAYYKNSKIVMQKICKYFNDIEYSNLVLIIFCSFVFLIGFIIFLNFDNIQIDVLLFIIIILCAFSFVLLIKFRINAIENKKYLQTLRENNDFYIKMDDENRIFKHNLMAKLSSIKSVSNKKAITLIDDFVIKTNKSISYSKKIKTIPYGINGIIYQRTYPYLEDINFKITNKIHFDIFNALKPRRYNVLVEKLVLSLDNAIEASLNSKNKVVVINLYDDDENIYIEIKNTFACNIDVDNLGALNYSTKGKKRGLGLFSVLRDNEASVKIKVINNYFISIISAKKQK